MESEQKGEGKLLGLEEAIRKFVKPGMRLHLAGGIGGPSAAICEIIRQYSGSNPGFELIQSTVTGHAINLIHCNLIRKLIFSACIEISASAHPSRVIQRAYAKGGIEFENWSLLSLQQRLMAGAMGFDYIPTRSIGGSTLAYDNRNCYREIESPFDPGEKTGIIKALNPDLSIIHGCFSDIFGNVVLQAPYGDDIWGSLASRGGVLVTVEKIVTSEVIERYSSLVKIPSFLVEAVSLAPLGMHPYALADPTGEIVESYEADMDFLEVLHEAFSDRRKLEEWVNSWIRDCPTHSDYLKKIGEQRVSALKKAAEKATVIEKGIDKPSPGESIDVYTPDEMVMIAAAREIVESVLKSGHKTMLVGAGSWSVSARFAYHELINRGYEIELLSGNGQIGYRPQPGELSTQSVSGIFSSRMLSDTIMTHGVFVGGENSRCLSVLGAGQVDRYGNINSSRTSSGKFLVGTGGANDAANANEVIVILNQSRERFVEKLPYVTAKGDRVSKVISTMGVFSKAPGIIELSLTACFPNLGGITIDKAVKEIQKNCGWSLKADREVRQLTEPTIDELRTLRSLLQS